MSKDTQQWRDTLSDSPPDGQVVLTKIHDDDGCRNVQPLKKRGSLWFFDDDSMYVYYRPTHWKELIQPTP